MNFSKRQRDHYYELHYFKPWTHLPVFSIGFLFGLLSKNSKIQLKGPYGKQVIYKHLINYELLLNFNFADNILSW